MSFIMEFAQNLILKLMEDPKERDRQFRQHLYTLQDRCEKAKEWRNFSSRPYGHWTCDRVNGQVLSDPQISRAPGRRDPYDEVLEEMQKQPK